MIPDSETVELWVINLLEPFRVPGNAIPHRTDSPPDCTSHAEQTRAAQFRHPRDADRYLASHRALRHVLASYLHADPSALRFEHGPWGKPALVGSRLAFNLSRSGALALIAVSNGRQVGVDIEQERALPDLESLAEQVCTPDERAMLAATPVSERDRTFVALWTRMEARAKMSGVGIGAIRPGAGLDFATFADHRVEQILDLSGYAACVAATGTDWRLVRRK